MHIACHPPTNILPDIWYSIDIPYRSMRGGMCAVLGEFYSNVLGFFVLCLKYPFHPPPPIYPNILHIDNSFVFFTLEWLDAVAEATGLTFICFVVINTRVLSAKRVDFGLFFEIFHFTPLDTTSELPRWIDELLRFDPRPETLPIPFQNTRERGIELHFRFHKNTGKSPINYWQILHKFPINPRLIPEYRFVRLHYLDNPFVSIPYIRRSR